MNRRAPLVAASCAGLALGAAYGASPAGAVCVAALAMVIAWTARGLRGVERRWVVGWLVASVALRIVTVAVLPWLVDPQRSSFTTIFGGDASYMIQRSIWIAKAFVGAPFAARDLFEAFEATYGWSGYTYALALLHVFFGVSPYATHLFSAVLFFAAIAILFRCAREAFGAGPAFAGLVMVTTMPSLFAWSIAPLKEAPTYVLAALAVRGTIWLLRPMRRWQVPAGALAVGVPLLLMYFVRPQSAQLTAVSLAAGAAGCLVYRHRRVAIAAAVAAAAVAAILALGAVPRANALVIATLEASTNHHMGNVLSTGHSYTVLDPGAYAFEGEMPRGARALGRFAVRATVRFFTVPEPWLLKSRFEQLLLPQQMAWYAVLGFAAIGLLGALRRDALLASLSAAFLVVGAVAIGLNSGNIGTLIRHRDAVVPFAMWLAAVGGTEVVSRSRRITIDRTMVVLPVVLLAIGVALAVVFRQPPPRPESVTPAVVYTPGTVVVHGRDLRPFLRALIMPTGQEPETRSRHERAPEAIYTIRTATEAHLTLPALPPGTYDFALFHGLDELARLSPAFTVARMAGEPTGVVIAEGRFTRLDPAATISTGDAVTSSDGAKVAEVLSVGDNLPDIEEIGPGMVKTWARLDHVVQRRATLRLRCRFATVRCRLLDQPVVADGELALPFGTDTRSFIVDTLRPDAPAWTMPDVPAADAVVDFVGWPGAQQWIHAGDRDLGTAHARALQPAAIVRIVAAEPFVGDAALGGPIPGQDLAFQAPLVRVRAIVRFSRLPSGALDFRGADVRAGSPIAFETATYLLRGTIVNVLPDGSRP